MHKILNLSLCFIEVKFSVDIPVLVGSGVTVNNVHEYRGVDGFIIGSHFKKHGMYENIVSY